MQEILALIRDYGVVVYALLFAYCAFKSGTLPLFAGYAAKVGALDVAAVFLVVLAGGYLGDKLRFALARRYGAGLVSKRPRLQRTLQVGTRLLERYGTFYIFAYRYPKGLRTIGALPVGLTPMPWLKFTLLNFGSAFLWSTLLVGAGYMLGHVFDAEAGSWSGPIAVVLLLLFAILSVLAWREVAKEFDKVGQSS
ncbi:MAG: DedA family protein [Bosea sp. (in: a-proteobacteria)]